MEEAQVISMEEAEKILRPHLETLYECIDGGIEEFKTVPSSLRVKITPTTQANIIRDLIVARARERFADVPEIRVLDRGRLFHLCIQDQLLIKFKKLDGRLRSSNIPTQNALAFINQAQLAQPRLPGMPPPPTNLLAGYQWNQLRTSAQVYVVCPNGQRNEWTLLVSPGSVHNGVPVVRLNTEADTQAQKKPRVMPKYNSDTQSNQGNAQQ